MKPAKCMDRLVNAGGVATAALIAVITLLLIYEVVTRYFFRSPSIWALDVARFAILYLTFFGGAWLLKEEGHVKVEILTSRFNPKNQALIHSISSVVAFAACGVFFWQAAALTWEAFTSGEFIDRSIVVPKALILFMMPLGMMLLCLQFLRRAWQYFVDYRARGEEKADPVRSDDSLSQHAR
jgi:C4-dicarboxylate transporter, DctQ subunit